MQRVRIERKNDCFLRKAEQSDKADIIAYYKKNIWKERNAESLYSWKYEANPAGNASAFIGVNQDGAVVASTYFMPWKLWAKKSEIGACQWVDLYVDMEYRGQPIPSEQLQSGLMSFRLSGSPICFAFPNNNSVPVHKKNNGIHLGTIERYTKPLNSEYIVARFVKWPILAKIANFFLNIMLRIMDGKTYLNQNGSRAHLNVPYVEEVTSANKALDIFWNKFSNNIPDKIMARKDSAYLIWKYVHSPNNDRRLYSLRRNGSVEGFIALESTPSTGYIVDILAVDESSLKSLISFAIKFFRRSHKDSIVFVSLENNMYFKAFENFGFIKRPEEKHFYIYLDETMPDKDYFLDPKKWHITIGDCDIERM